MVFINLSYAKTETAFFSGGHFKWLEADFNQLPGVLLTVNGFIENNVTQPLNTQRLFAIKVVYNPLKISYPQLLEYFWRHIDPTNNHGQFCDVGSEYQSAIFYLNAQQKQQALASKIKVAKKFKAVRTLILPLKQFNAADDNSQGYYQNYYLRYKLSRFYCGRDRGLAKIWH